MKFDIFIKMESYFASLVASSIAPRYESLSGIFARLSRPVLLT